MTPLIEHLWKRHEERDTYKKYVGGYTVYTPGGDEYTLPKDATLIIPMGHYLAEARSAFKEDEIRGYVRQSEAMLLDSTDITLTSDDGATHVRVSDRGSEELLRMFSETHGESMNISPYGDGKILVGGRLLNQPYITVNEPDVAFSSEKDTL